MTLLGNRGDKRHFAFYGEYHSHMTGRSARREAESLLPIRSRNWRKGDTHEDYFCSDELSRRRVGRTGIDTR